MEYKPTKYFFGYLKTVLYDRNHQNINPITDSDCYVSKGHAYLDIFSDQREWSKTQYDSYAFKKGVKNVEQKLNVTFPLEWHQYGKLTLEQQKSIRWSLYKQSTQYQKVIYCEYKELIKHNIKFTVPIPIMNHGLEKVNLDLLTIPDDLLQYVVNGKAKILFYQDAEGFLNRFQSIEWLFNFGRKFGLSKQNYLVESANIKFTELIKHFEENTPHTINFTPIISTLFEDDPWFLNTGKWHPSERSKHYQTFFEYLDNKTTRQYDTKMMCLNRRFSAERAWVFYNILHNDSVKQNTIYSLHNPYGTTKETCIVNIDSIVGACPFEKVQKYRDEIEKIKEWFQAEGNFDFVNGHSYDRTDQDTNWATVLNPGIHHKTVVNVVLETHQRPSSELFLSEKTFRPIYTAQPFVIFGNPGTLKALKDKGYKTFDKFWDESYDEDIRLSERLRRLFNTMEFIANTPWHVIDSWIEEFEPILQHNFNVLMQVNRYTELFKNFHFHSYSKKALI